MDISAANHVTHFTVPEIEEAPADTTTGQLPTAHIHSEQGAGWAASRLVSNT